MKPELEKIQLKPSRSFTLKLVERENRPLLTKAWHYHPEIEICYTTHSKGKRYVGNNISRYTEQDLVILGSNVPHGFTTPEFCKQYVIQFEKDFLGKNFLEHGEMHNIQTLIHNSKRGLLLTGQALKKADKKIKDLFIEDQSDLNRLLKLLDLLEFIALSPELTPICSDLYSSYISPKKLDSIKKIFDYIENNFKRELTIQDVCKVVNLTESAFYKFMKRHTNRKFTSILNEYRIDYATRLLISSELSIAEISYRSGYSNLSYFNRVFKRMKLMTPRQLRNSYKK